MTNATNGLHRALGRAAASASTAIADMQPADLLAGMTDEQKAAISAALAPQIEASGEPSHADPAVRASADSALAASIATLESSASEDDARIKAVAHAVATDAACKGKSDIALSMLADDDYASLSASGLVKLIGNAAVTASPDDVIEAAEAAARAEMREAIYQGANSNIDPDGGGADRKDKATNSSVWDAAISAVCPDARS